MKTEDTTASVAARKWRKQAKQRRKDRPPIVDPETGEIPFGNIEDDLRALGL
jgi:hypothetical protein